MILGERELHFYPGCISLIPTKELHTTNTFGKKAGWEWMYFDIHEVLKKLYPGAHECGGERGISGNAKNAGI
jgi:hypothetical protein